MQRPLLRPKILADKKGDSEIEKSKSSPDQTKVDQVSEIIAQKILQPHYGLLQNTEDSSFTYILPYLHRTRHQTEQTSKKEHEIWSRFEPSSCFYLCRIEELWFILTYGNLCLFNSQCKRRTCKRN